MNVYSSKRKHASNRVILIEAIKKILVRYGDIHVKDSTILRQPVLFHACDLGVSGDGE